MVLLKGPCHSFEAHGTLAGALTFASVGGTAYARRPVTPPDPESPSQIANRTILKFLAQTWRTLGPTVQALWENAFKDRPRGYQAYVACNIERWWRFEFPIDRPTPTPIGAPTASTGTTSVYGSIWHRTIGPGTTPPNWGYAILYRELVSPARDPHYLVALLDNIGPISFNLRLTPHVSGLGQIIPFHDTGEHLLNPVNLTVNNP